MTSHQISLRADTTGSPKHSRSHTSSIAKITPSSLPTASSSFLHWLDHAGILSSASSAITHGSPYRQRVRCYLRATVIRTRSWIHCQRRGRGAVDVVGLGEFSFGDGDRVGHEGGSGITNRWMSKRGSDSVLEIDAVVFNFLWRYFCRFRCTTGWATVSESDFISFGGVIVTPSRQVMIWRSSERVA